MLTDKECKNAACPSDKGAFYGFKWSLLGGESYRLQAMVLEDWAAAGFTDTLLRWKMKPEVVHGEKKDIQSRVQARGGQAGH
jgi:hypothetical protein